LGSIPLYVTIGEDEWEAKPYHLLVIKSKNGKPRVVPISPKAVKVFFSLMNGQTTGEYVFTSFRTGGGLTEIKKGFVSACKAAGIPHGANTQWPDLP
jgi:integrase